MILASFAFRKLLPDMASSKICLWAAQDVIDNNSALENFSFCGEAARQVA